MVLVAYVKKSSGKAKCMMCGKLIKLKQKRIIIRGFRTEASLHSDAKDCIEGRR